jgi:hypothetical protein
MATASLSERSVIVILARQAALKQIKQQRQRQGLRKTLPMSVLSRLAISHLEQHPELLAEAAASPIVQNLRITNRRRRPDPKRELLCRNQVQNGAMK